MSHFDIFIGFPIFRLERHNEEWSDPEKYVRIMWHENETTEHEGRENKSFQTHITWGCNCDQESLETERGSE
jgi:hypothetical protein